MSYMSEKYVQYGKMMQVDYKILCQMGQRPTFKQAYSSPTFSKLK